MQRDINDQDYSIKAFFNSDGTKKYDRIDNVVVKSTNCTPVKNTRKKKQKPKGMSALAKKAIIFVALGAGIVIGSHELDDSIDTYKKDLDVRKTISSVVGENTHTFGYNANEKRPYWYYDVDKIAESVLNENKEYDIDTRIYGSYSELNEYKKEEHMDQIFVEMSKLIGSNPEKYTEEEIKACLHGSFSEYLDSKNITLEDYTKLMDKVIRAYAKEDKQEEEITQLLGELNGGAR